MSQSAKNKHLLVIGSGPGGYAAAFRAADLGMKVTLVTADRKPGGVCLHCGCIPSKALLHVAKILNEAHEASAYGVKFAEPVVDLTVMRDWKTSVVNKLAAGIEQLCGRHGINYIAARAKFVSSREVALAPAPGQPAPNVERIAFDHAIIATGSSPAMPPSFQLGDPRIMDSTSALELADVPGRLLVVGGGYIGLELGTVYRALGTKVTVVELTANLLPGADRDLVKPLAKRLEGSFEKILLNTKVAKLEPTPDGVVAHLEGLEAPKTMTFDRVLVAVGRRPNSRDLGLENTQVQLDERGFIRVNRKQQSNDPHILAIGDVAGEPMLAHKASREGKVAVEALAGEPAEFDNLAIPAVVFTDPEIAWCGMTESQAEAEGREIGVMRFPWAVSGRAQTMGRPEGLTKVLFDPLTERVLGMGIVGVGAGELISEGVLAVETAAVARDLADTIHPHPTLSETVMESAESYFGASTHMYKPAAKSNRAAVKT